MTTPAREKGELGHYYPFTMPDGKAVLFTIGSSPTTSDIAVLDLETGRYWVDRRGIETPIKAPTKPYGVAARRHARRGRHTQPGIRHLGFGISTVKR